jgi:hypothetical protein
MGSGAGLGSEAGSDPTVDSAASEGGPVARVCLPEGWCVPGG